MIQNMMDTSVIHTKTIAIRSVAVAVAEQLHCSQYSKIFTSKSRELVLH